MTIYYHENFTDSWAPIAGRLAGFLVMVPDSYNPDTPSPAMQHMHGKGQGLGGATPKSLKTFVSDPVWRPVPQAWVDAVDKYGIIGVIPAYGDGDRPQPEDFDYIYKTVREKYKTVDKWLMSAFSWGCGSQRKYYRSSLERASRFACAVDVSGTVESDGAGATWENIAKANVPVWAPVHKDDNVVTSKPTLNAVSGINSFNPLVKAEYTLYDGNGHGPTNAVLGDPNFRTTAGTGLIDPTETVYEWYLDILKNGPRPMKRGTLTTTPTTPTVPTTPEQPTTVTAAFNIAEGDVLTTSEFELDASASKGATSFLWDIQPEYGNNKPGPWSVKPEGGAGGGPKKKVVGLGNGDYWVALTVNGKVKSEVRKFTVKIGNNPSSKTVKSFDSVTDQILWSDGTTEKGSAKFENNRWVLKDSTGKNVYDASLG